jgi:kynurenine formamidase
MARRFIDISAALQNDVPADPPGLGPKIEYIDHERSLAQILPFFPGLRQEDLPDGQGWAVELVQLSTHNGAHLDAPWHFHPTMNEGERAWTIDEVPLEWCFQPGVKLDFRHFPDGYVATAVDVEAELERIGHKLKPLDIVLVNTSAGLKYGRPDYVASGCGMGAEATLHLLRQGVRVTGTDGWSWDAPFVQTRSATPRPMTRRSSGRGTKRAATSAIAISRNCTISRRCPRPASRSHASR